MKKRFIFSISLVFVLCLCGRMWAQAPPAAADNLIWQPLNGPQQSAKELQLSATMYLSEPEKAGGAGKYFLLSVHPGHSAAAQASDVVVLIDTSASMVMPHRQQANDMLDSVLGAMFPEDRLQIMACDAFTANYMKGGFVPASSPAVAAAMEKLAARAPLGSMDMEKAMKTAAACFGPVEADRNRVIVFIGQGTSRANLLTMEKLAELGDMLAQQQISVVALPVGPNIDRQLLGTLVAKTGGDLLAARADGSMPEVGAAIHAVTYWVDTAEPDTGMTIMPAGFLPLNSNRNTLVLGTLDAAAVRDTYRLKLKMKQGGDAGVSVSVPKDAYERDQYAYVIRKMVEHVQGKNIWLPLVDESDVAGTMNLVDNDVDSMLAMVDKLMENPEAVNLDAARKLVNQAKTMNPGHPSLRKYDRLVEGFEAGDRGRSDPFGGFMTAPGAGLELAARGAMDQAEAESATVDVQKTINDARQLLSEQPEAAADELKQKIADISSRGLSPQVQRSLLDKLGAALRDSQNRAEEMSIRDTEMRRRIALERQRKIAAENMRAEEEKLEQWMQRFDTLMQERRYRDAEEDVAARIADERPNLPMAVAAVFTSRTAQANYDNMNLRARRNKAYVNCLFNVEESNIPFPDDPPIQYPDSGDWKRLTEKRVAKYSSMDLAQSGATEKKIMEQLKETTVINAQDEPLSSIIAKLKERHSIEIQVNSTAIEEELGLTEDEPFTLDVKGISLGAALRLLLGSKGLMYIVKDEVLQITTQEKANENLTTRVYPVADLVLPIENLSPMGGGIIGGGQGSSGGVGGSSSFSGSSSGGSSGMSGMSGMGSGFFNVPSAVTPRRAVSFYNMADELTVAPAAKKTTADKSRAMQPKTVKTAAAKTAAPVTLAPAQTKTDAEIMADREIQRLLPASESVKSLIVPKGQDVAKWWDAYFTAAEAKEGKDALLSSAQVRATARLLMKRKDYAQTITMIEAALRHNQPQSWMYEALAIAMIGAGRPEEDIQRAIFSTLEFCESPEQMMLIGAYVERLGLPEAAMTIYRQVGQLYPTAPEPFVFALNIARRADVNDADMIRWAALGLLAQELPPSRKLNCDTALRCLQAQVAKLELEGKTEAAKQLTREMDLAMQRDCLVKVSWTGNADIDLYVQEPSGTICCLRNPRSAGGGYLLQDGFSKKAEDRDANPVASETYVCPKGFGGDYKILAKRVWGDVTDNKVQVEIIVHYRTGEQKTMKSVVSLENGEAGTQFYLANGRRTDSLQEQQLATTVRNVSAMSHVAQQLQQHVDDRAMMAVNESSGGYTSSTPIYYPSYQGAVGYQPEIIWLPQGAQMSVTGVISADRRYVRITAAPLFSTIPKVTVFNFATGEYSAYNPNEDTGGSDGSSNVQ